MNVTESVSSDTDNGGNTTTKRSSRAGFADSVLGTRNLMMVTALAVIGLIILIPLNYIAPAAGASQDAVMFGVALMGLWCFPYLLPSVVVKRPGSTLVASIIMGVVCIFTTPSGPAALMGNIIGGLFLEVPLALFLYRKYTLPVFLFASAVFGALNGVLYLVLLEQVVGISISGPIVALSIASSVAGGAVAYAVGSALNRAGMGNRER
ncbi:ECF transporter S component [Corynebacterium cystitidis]|uniref:Energy-coupling factor transport system substrate-specific component n=1 Tax=Corynebacterium cystitidis DSM 20524 TaxID=1121357 RepID=A0A1H9UU04_9CORY|nr:ECF transporter S component [Corynebacterium cystitidis]WJY83717.1 ABC-type cobalt transport system, permease component [Corynebacterium cystitidis DSM 20524]SES12811.1 energy-coupling factor transport system substrate-specific component [Corynebacterium cystitidis DSM 20524]SNV91171.1 HMP/thiamine permease [Corynebacterium cystitidis]